MEGEKAGEAGRLSQVCNSPKLLWTQGQQVCPRDLLGGPGWLRDRAREWEQRAAKRRKNSQECPSSWAGKQNGWGKVRLMDALLTKVTS